ncbi:RNA polymerase sigma factor [Larkinella insperata]|uniref:RNA polymerase sigma factor n=1 Tax=Larkinella insperata TaxID=332158 RepID=A0ABW3QKT9_9BACT
MSLPPDAVKFLTIIEVHKGIIYKVANAYCRDKECRKDLIQEITLQLWLAFPTYTNQFRLTTWLYRIALNVSISFYRKQTSRHKLNQPLTTEILSLTQADDDVDTEADLSLLHGFIRQLKELDRAVMLLYLEERSQQEIAEILGITPTNVSTKVARIKDQLRQKFAALKNS